MVKTIFITGATSGIGKATAEKFAQNHYRVIVTGRRAERLLELKKDFNQKYSTEIHPLVFDVRNRNEVEEAIDSLPAEWKSIDMLVNNAGLAAGFSNFETASLDDWEQMIDTNLKGLLFVTRKVLPLMSRSVTPYIFNVGSTAGKYVYENGNVYCATKFAVNALSQSMRIDLLKQNIRVTAIHPGAVETEFSLVRFKGDEEKARQVYKGFNPLTGADIADVIYYCANTNPNVCISELIVTPTAQANPYYINRKNG